MRLGRSKNCRKDVGPPNVNSGELSHLDAVCLYHGYGVFASGNTRKILPPLDAKIETLEYDCPNFSRQSASPAHGMTARFEIGVTFA